MYRRRMRAPAILRAWPRLAIAAKETAHGATPVRGPHVQRSVLVRRALRWIAIKRGRSSRSLHRY